MGSSDMWNVISYIGNVVGIVAFAVQFTIFLDRKREDRKVQYLLKSIKDITLVKNVAWNAQFQMATTPGMAASPNEIKLLRKAADEFAEITSCVSSLEKVIDPTNSATSESLKTMIDEQEAITRVNEANRRRIASLEMPQGAEQKRPPEENGHQA